MALFKEGIGYVTAGANRGFIADCRACRGGSTSFFQWAIDLHNVPETILNFRTNSNNGVSVGTPMGTVPETRVVLVRQGDDG